MDGMKDKNRKLLYSDDDLYGIYQLKDDDALHYLHFRGTGSLMKAGVIDDTLSGIRPENYELVYVGGLSGLQEEYPHCGTQPDMLEAIFAKFNINHPADFKGHSLSVSDVVVLHDDSGNSAYYVDTFGFTALSGFIQGLE